MKNRETKNLSTGDFDEHINQHKIEEVSSFSPANLRSESVMTIYTLMGKSIIVGRESNNYAKTIIGLHRFYVRIKSVYYAAADNPFADLILIVIEKDIYRSLNDYEITIKSLTEKIKMVEKSNDKNYQFKVSYKLDLSPLKIKLNYRLQYGHLLARLISLYDQVIVLLLKMQVYGALNKKQLNYEMQKQGKPIRRIYRYGQFWKNYNIKRNDAILMTDDFKSASVYFEKTFSVHLNQDILLKKELPEYGPNIRL